MATPDRISTKGEAPLKIAPAVVTDVHDGDTFHVSLPMYALIPGVEPGGWIEDVRLAHVNAPELSTAAGQTALTSVRGWILSKALAPATGGPFLLHVWGRDKYGRLLADLEATDGELLSAYVLTLGGAVPMLVHEQLAAPRG